MKKVIFNKEDKEVSISNVDEDKIYVFEAIGDFYKAHRTSYNKFAFIDLESSRCLANGEHDSLQLLLKSNSSEEIYEFDSVKEFAQWILDNCEE